MTTKKWFASYTVHSDRSITCFFKAGEEEFGGKIPLKAHGTYFNALYQFCEMLAEMHNGRLEALCIDQTNAR